MIDGIEHLLAAVKLYCAGLAPDSEYRVIAEEIAAVIDDPRKCVKVIESRIPITYLDDLSGEVYERIFPNGKITIRGLAQLVAGQITGFYWVRSQEERASRSKDVFPFAVIERGPSLYQCQSHDDLIGKLVRVEELSLIQPPLRSVLDCKCRFRCVSRREAI